MHFITPETTGTQFHMSEWPMHTTIADVFTIDRELSDIESHLEILLSSINSMDTYATKDTVLGITPVILLHKTRQLSQLHDNVVQLLESCGTIFSTPEYNHAGFLPHCTIQPSGRLNTNDKVTIDSISLIDMFPSGDWQQRRILSTFKLQ